MLRRSVLLAAALLAASPVLSATDPSPQSSEKPFAQAHVVLQISDNSPQKQTLVLNVASNLIKHYGADAVDVEIVAFGPGLQMLLLGNANSPRIQSLNSEGVRFAACGNTMKKFSQVLEKEPEMNPHAVEVSAGVVRIMELVGQGYTLIRP